MHFFSIRQALAALFVAVMVSACGGGTSASPPAAGISVTPGDGRATVTWAMEQDVQYWVFYAPVSTTFPVVTTSNWINIPGAQAFINVKSPFVVPSLYNGLQYSFVVNARRGDGPGGDGTPAVNVAPRPAGAQWAKGGDMGTNTLRAVTFGVSSADTLGYYLAMGDNGAAYKSATGLSWTAVPGTNTTQINSAIYVLSKFVGVGNAGTITYSTDLLTWAAGTSNTTQNLNSVSSNGALLVAVGDAGTIRTSTDGITWAAATSVPTTQNLYSVTYSSNGFWIAVGAGGTLLVSTDGTTWTAQVSNTTADLYAVTVQVVSSYVFVAVGDAGTVVTSADNGTTWTPQASGISGNLRAVSPTSSQLLAVGTNGLVATSLDGKAWVTVNSGTSADLYDVINGLSQYVAVGAGGTNINSQ